MNIHKLFRLLETERLVNLANPVVSALFEGRLTPVMFAGNTTVDRALYERARIHLPMTVNYGITEYGKTSFVFTQTLTDNSDGRVLATTLRKVVMMDVTTRKSCDIPHVWVERFGDDIRNSDPMGPKFVNVPLLRVPETVFTSSIVVQPEDCDFVYHTNQCNYTGYALNAMAFAVMKGALDGFQGDIANYGVKSVKAIHTGESFPGDELHVDVWSEREDSTEGGEQRHVMAAVSNKTQTIFQGKYSFYADQL